MTTAPLQKVGLGAYLFRAAMVNWIASLLTILYALFITPIVIRALNADLYGVWTFLNGLLAYSSLFYVGLGAAFIKYLSQYRALQDRGAISRLASVVLVLYGTIGTICLVLCVVIAPYVPSMFAQPLAPADSRQTVVACALLGSRLLFMFVATVFSGVLIAEERITTASTVNIVAIICRSLAVPLTLTHHTPLITLAVIMSVSAAGEACALAFCALRTSPKLRIGLVMPKVKELSLLYGFGVRSFFLDLSAWLINYTDTVVIGLVIGATGVALYSIPLQLATYGRVVVQGMMSGLLPRLTAYETEGDRAALGAAYLRVSRLTNYVAALIALNLLALGVPFLRLWVGDTFANGSFGILACLAVAGFCQALSTQAAVPFFQAMHSLRTPVSVLLVEAFLNLGLSIWFARQYGVIGVALGTLLPTFMTTIVMPWRLCHELRVRFSELMRGAVLPALVLIGLAVPLNFAFDRFLLPTSYPQLILRGLANVLLGVACAMVVLPQEDVAVVQGWVQRLVPNRA